MRYFLTAIAALLVIAPAWSTDDLTEEQKLNAAIEAARERVAEKERVCKAAIEDNRRRSERWQALNGLRWPYYPNTYERFTLWNGCKPIAVAIRITTEGGSKLTSERIQTAVHLRMRAARIFSKTLGPEGAWLLVWVNVTEYAFGFTVAFHRQVTHYPVSYIDDTRFPASVWHRAIPVGTHNNDASGDLFILASVIEEVDVFINEYLRVNADDC